MKVSTTELPLLSTPESCTVRSGRTGSLALVSGTELSSLTVVGVVGAVVAVDDGVDFFDVVGAADDDVVGDELLTVGDAVTVTTVGDPLMPAEQPVISRVMAAIAASATEAADLSLALDMVSSSETVQHG